MLIEAASPITIRLPSGEVHLTPGQRVNLSDEQAKRLIEKVPDKVRAVHQRPVDWLGEWRYLATITSGIEPGDPRLSPILKALDQCDTAFLAGDSHAFKLAAAKVEEAMKAR